MHKSYKVMAAALLMVFAAGDGFGRDANFSGLFKKLGECRKKVIYSEALGAKITEGTSDIVFTAGVFVTMGAIKEVGKKHHGNIYWVADLATVKAFGVCRYVEESAGKSFALEGIELLSRTITGP